MKTFWRTGCCLGNVAVQIMFSNTIRLRTTLKQVPFERLYIAIAIIMDIMSRHHEFILCLFMGLSACYYEYEC